MRSYSSRPSSWNAMLGLWGLGVAFGPRTGCRNFPQRRLPPKQRKLLSPHPARRPPRRLPSSNLQSGFTRWRR